MLLEIVLDWSFSLPSIIKDLPLLSHIPLLSHKHRANGDFLPRFSHIFIYQLCVTQMFFWIYLDVKCIKWLWLHGNRAIFFLLTNLYFSDYYFFLFFSPGRFSGKVGHFVIGGRRKQTNKKMNLATLDKRFSGRLAEKMTWNLKSKKGQPGRRNSKFLRYLRRQGGMSLVSYRNSKESSVAGAERPREEKSGLGEKFFGHAEGLDLIFKVMGCHWKEFDPSVMKHLWNLPSKYILKNHSK